LEHKLINDEFLYIFLGEDEADDPDMLKLTCLSALKLKSVYTKVAVEAKLANKKNQIPPTVADIYDGLCSNLR